MTKGLFSQNIIAVIWDFDKTLIPGYMQEPMFKHYGVSSKQFFDEVSYLPKFYKEKGNELIAHETLYLNHILTYVRHGIFKELDNKKLRNFGKAIEFYKGLPDFFNTIKESVKHNSMYKKHEITVENYIVSTGLRANDIR